MENEYIWWNCQMFMIYFYHKPVVGLSLCWREGRALLITHSPIIALIMILMMMMTVPKGETLIFMMRFAIVSTIINTEPYKSNNGSDGDGYGSNENTDQPDRSNNDSCRKKGEVRVLRSNNDHVSEWSVIIFLNIIIFFLGVIFLFTSYHKVTFPQRLPPL